MTEVEVESTSIVANDLESTRAMDRAPMIPVICSDQQFLYCTDLQLEDHAANPVLVAQLMDSLKCWLSHINDTYRLIDEVAAYMDEAETLNVNEIAKKIRRLETETSFFMHFERLEPKVVIRCLQKYTPAHKLLERLDKELLNLTRLHDEYKLCMDLMDMAASYFPNGEWPMREIADTAGPLFSALRALHMGTEVFGPKHSKRFLSLVTYIVTTTENSIAAGCGSAFKRILDRPKSALDVSADLVAAQDGAISIQEAYHNLRLGVVEHAVDRATAETIFAGVDDEALFSVLEWEYHRCTALLQLVDALRKDENKIGSSLTDRLEPLDMMNPAAIDQVSFLAEVENIVQKDAPNPDAVLERMGVTAANTNRKNAVQQYAPRAPFEELSNTLSVDVLFNPPEVTICGGPVSEKTLDTATRALPQCCSNKGVLSLRKLLAPCVWKSVTGHFDEASSAGPTAINLGPVVRLEIPEQFCDSDIAQTHFLSTLLDLIEAEDAWSMRDCHAYNAGANQVHTFIFHRQRLWDEKE